MDNNEVSPFFPVIIVQNQPSASSTLSSVFSYSTGSLLQSFLSRASGGCHCVCASRFIILSSCCSVAGRGCAGTLGMSSSAIPAESIPSQQSVFSTLPHALKIQESISFPPADRDCLSDFTNRRLLVPGLVLLAFL